ncbi:hypothetical protein [Paenibacillus sp. CF384]|uniref:hypothetical protein n=1 Tax=Paenibacillus sp. CF384 TaxID=1884382 RepID=UPI000B807BDD|nr:hypothetical protein [Paenibacillus sp. CF384]
MEAQVGMMVRINRGGPESVEGRLLAVKQGYLVLKTTGGVVYVSTAHVKSITDLPGGSTGLSHAKFIEAGSFVGVLRDLTKKFVQINWGGPERIEGFIAGVGNDALLLVVGPELVQIPLYHIKTVKTAGIYASKGSKGSNGSRGNSSGGSSGGSGGSGGSSGGSGGSGGNASGRNNATKKAGKKGNKKPGYYGGK